MQPPLVQQPRNQRRGGKKNKMSTYQEEKKWQLPLASINKVLSLGSQGVIVTSSQA